MSFAPRTDDDVQAAAALTGRLATPPANGDTPAETRSKEEIAREEVEDDDLTPEEADEIIAARREGRQVPDRDGEAETTDDEEDYLTIFEDRFKGDPKKAVQSYRNLETKLGEQGSELSKMRKQLADAGYMWDADGNPVKVDRQAPQTAAQQQVQEDDPNVAERLPDGGYKGKDGIIYDNIGMPVVDEATWDQLAKDDPKLYTQAYIKYHEMRRQKQAEFDAKRNDRIGSVRADGEKEIDAYLKEVGFPDTMPEIIEVRNAARKRFDSLPPEVRSEPGAMQLAMTIEMAPRLPDIMKKHAAQLAADVATRVQTNKRTIASDSGSVAQPTQQRQGNDAILTREQNAERIRYNSRRGESLTQQQWKDLGDNG